MVVLVAHISRARKNTWIFRHVVGATCIGPYKYLVFKKDFKNYTFSLSLYLKSHILVNYLSLNEQFTQKLLLFETCMTNFIL